MATMVERPATSRTHEIHAAHDAAAVLFRSVVIGLIAFLTVVDLFATQAIPPSLV
jgi:hypothetical protein